MSPMRYTVLPDVPEPWPGAGRPAWDAATHSHVLLRRASDGSQRSAEDLQQRMALQLPGLQRMLGAGADAEGGFSAWESLHGELLSSVVSRGPLSLQDYAHLSLQVLDTLGWLHEGGWRTVALGADAVLLLHPAPGAMPAFKIVADIAPFGDSGDEAKREDLHRFALLSWLALVGRDFNPSEPDIAGKLAQKRPDVPAGAGAALSAALGADEQKRPSDARALRRIMEMALGAQVQMAPAWMPPPMMYPPPGMQPAWQPAPMMEMPPPQMPAPAVTQAPMPVLPPAPHVEEPVAEPTEPACSEAPAPPVQEHAPETAAPAPLIEDPPEPPVPAAPPPPATPAKPVARSPGAITGQLAKAPGGSAAAPAKPAAPSQPSRDEKDRPDAPAGPKPFPWGPLIGGGITLVLAVFLGKIFFYPLWENWRKESNRRAANERAEVARPAAPSSNTASKADDSQDGKPVELPASNVAALRKEMRKTVTIYGKAVKTGESKDKKNGYLYFSEKPGAAAYLSIEQKGASGSSVKALEKFVGKEVSATGEVTQYQGKPFLKVKAMSDIKTL